MLVSYVDNSYYQVRVFSLKPGTPPKDVREFFDSFKPKPARETPKPKDKS